MTRHLAAPKSIAPDQTSILGRPPLLEGEDFAAYYELLARVSGDVKPTDIVEEIWVRDVVDLTWEILRWRRVRISLLSTAMLNKLVDVLEPFLREPSAPTEETRSGILLLDFTPRPPSPERILARELAEKCAARDRTAINRVDKLLASKNIEFDVMMAPVVMQEFVNLERIDRCITIAEGRRNAVLREIDRRRLNFAYTLRGSVQTLEQSKTKMIESKAVTSKNQPKKNAA